MSSPRNYARNMWQRERLSDLSRIEPVSRYEAMEGKESERVVTFQAETSDESAFALGNGRFLINYIDLNSYNTDNGGVVAHFAVRPDSFQLRSYSRNRQLVLEQRRSNSPWRGLLILEPGALADSLALVHDQMAFTRLPNAGITLRAANSEASLHLFLKSLSRRQQADTVSYSLEGSALIEFR